MTVRQVQPVTYQKPKRENTSKKYRQDEFKKSRALKKKKKLEKQQHCRTLRKKLRKEKQKVKDRCNKNREIYCDLPEKEIEQRNLWQAFRRNSNERMPGNARISITTQVETMQKKLKKEGC
jgi:hypothetical protein